MLAHGTAKAAPRKELPVTFDDVPNPTLVIFDGTIEAPTDPNADNSKPEQAGQYWQKVTAQNGPLALWLKKHDIHPKAPVLSFGLEGPGKAKSWEEYIHDEPLCKNPVAPDEIFPDAGTDRFIKNNRHRRDYDLKYLAAQLTIRWLGKHDPPRRFKSLHLLMLSDDRGNKRNTHNPTEAAQVEKALFEKLPSQRGMGEKWLDEVNSKYSVEKIATAVFPRDGKNFIEDAASYEDKDGDIPLRATVYEVRPKESLNVLNYFQPEPSAIFTMTATGYEAKIAVHGVKRGPTDSKYRPVSLQVLLTIPDKATEILKSWNEEEINTADFTGSLSVALTENTDPANVLVHLRATFCYRPLIDNLPHDIGLEAEASTPIAIMKAEPPMLPDGSRHLTHADLARFPGASQSEVLDMLRQQTRNQNVIYIAAVAIAAAVLVFLASRSVYRRLYRFPSPRIAAALKSALADSDQAAVVDNDMGQAACFAGTIQYDLRTSADMPGLLIGYLCLENTAGTNKKGLYQELKGSAVISSRAEIPVRNQDAITVLNPDISTQNVLTVNDFEQDELRFSGKGKWPVRLELNKLTNMEKTVFPDNLLQLRGCVAVDIAGQKQNQAFMVQITVRPMPCRFVPKIILYAAQKV